MGAIANPGRYAFNNSMTVLDLLAEAGGPTENAYLSEITVINKTQTSGPDSSQSFDLEAFVKEPQFERLPVIRAGDTLYIPDITQSNWHVFINGVTDVFKILSVLAITGG